MLKGLYSELVQESADNAVLGNPEEYYKIYTEADLNKFKQMQTPKFPVTLDDWMVTPAK